MNTKLKRKYKAVQEALEALYSDTTVTTTETRAALEEVQADVEAKLLALDSDSEGKPE